MQAKQIVITDTAPTIWRARAVEKRLAQNGIAYQPGGNLVRGWSGLPGKQGFFGTVFQAFVIGSVVDRRRG